MNVALRVIKIEIEIKIASTLRCAIFNKSADKVRVLSQKFHFKIERVHGSVKMKVLCI